jgi:hypothetical protein
MLGSLIAVTVYRILSDVAMRFSDLAWILYHWNFPLYERLSTTLRDRSAGAVLVSDSGSGNHTSNKRLFIGFLRRVFGGTNSVVRGTLCLFRSAFGLKFFVAGNFADRLFDGALRSVSGTFNGVTEHFGYLTRVLHH